MIIGIFHPVINWCGGAEWVAINIINTLKEHGHQVILLTNKPLNQPKFLDVFNRKVSVDEQIVFPFAVFPPASYHNIYTDSIRSWMLKLKCEVLIDTYSSAILSGANIYYMDYTLLNKLLPNLRNKIYYYPYRRFLEFSKRDIRDKLILANSKFSANVIKAELSVDPYILYPPVSRDILNRDETEFSQTRENTVITVARISESKNLKIIPYIAKLTDKEITFIIAGLLESKKALNSLLSLINELKVSDRVKILTNARRDHLKRISLNSKVYLHLAINERFGISIVEAMSLGCIPVVHDSGGPREFVPQDLCYKSVEEAAEKVENAIDRWSPNEASVVSKIADRFSENNFSKQFIDLFDSHFK